MKGIELNKRGGGYDPLLVKTELRKLAFYCRNRVFSTKRCSSDSATSKQREKQKRTPLQRSLGEGCGERHSLKEIKKMNALNTMDGNNASHINDIMIWNTNPGKKLTGSGSGTARDTQTETAPLNLAKKDALKRPKTRVTGSGSDIAGDALPRAAPLLKSLAKGNPLIRPKKDQ